MVNSRSKRTMLVTLDLSKMKKVLFLKTQDNNGIYFHSFSVLVILFFLYRNNFSCLERNMSFFIDFSSEQKVSEKCRPFRNSVLLLIFKVGHFPTPKKSHKFMKSYIKKKILDLYLKKEARLYSQSKVLYKHVGILGYESSIPFLRAFYIFLLKEIFGILVLKVHFKELFLCFILIILKRYCNFPGMENCAECMRWEKYLKVFIAIYKPSIKKIVVVQHKHREI